MGYIVHFPKMEIVLPNAFVDTYENSNVCKYQDITSRSFLNAKDHIRTILESMCDILDNRCGTIWGKLLDDQNSYDGKLLLVKF